MDKGLLNGKSKGVGSCHDFICFGIMMWMADAESRIREVFLPLVEEKNFPGTGTSAQQTTSVSQPNQMPPPVKH
ncbi:hypothetical protein Pyn_09279 [Prunus yedoensis var. nudiflora]|uniref:Uncharacterized protein n=1 Tax=Prunus yedoensis var. nudiflora TaxID=2094558 RepID=A0A314ZC71_PRUYE|nr:hypothetical protein Pyn_09279 [Prunus yedoensis var. nudiflora]